MRLFARASAHVVAVALVSPALAQIPIAGALSDATTGPLTSGNVYHVTSSINVPPGATLTIQPNVVVKLSGTQQFSVNGTLLVDGSGPDSIVFTDLRDDAFGGDSNGDGNASVPAPGGWGSIVLAASSSASDLRGLTVRYAGVTSAGLRLVGSSAALTDCRVDLSGTSGFEVGLSSRPTLTSCTASNCVGEAFDDVALQAVPGFSGLAATGNGFDRIRVLSASTSSGTDLTIGPGNLIDSTLYLATGMNVLSGSSLTLQAGTVVKFAAGVNFGVGGTLTCQGTAAAPIVLTDERDDTVGGDTNGDGAASTPAPGWWNGLLLTFGSDASVVEHTSVRYAGSSAESIQVQSNGPVLRNVTVHGADGDGVDLSNRTEVTVDGLAVTDCGGVALTGVAIQNAESIDGLQFSGNGFDRVEITSAVLAGGESITLSPTQGFQGVLFVASNVSVQPGALLRIDSGTILKMGFDRSVTVRGVLESLGSPTDPVVFTDERNDARGGDSNGDGNASAPSPGWWREVAMQPTSDGSRIEFTEIEYGGRFGPSLRISNAAVTMERSVVRASAMDGIDFGSTTKPGSYDRVRVDGCGGAAMTGVRLDRLQDITLARGAGNGLNTIEILTGVVTGAVTIEPQNQFNGSLLVRANVAILPGGSLNLQPGVVLKMGSGLQFVNSGSLSIRGSFETPVVITSERDDSIGGDTNGDGAATAPAPGDWRTVVMTGQAVTSFVVGLELRYGGAIGESFRSDSPQTVIRQLRAERSLTAGAAFTAYAGSLQRVAAFGNGGVGIDLRNGSLPVRQLTAASNGDAGVRRALAFGGTVSDSIAWGNAGPNFEGFAAGELRFSDGDPALAGQDGNIDTDPLFVDLLAGDLRLTDVSPCFDTGDPASPLDPDGTRADMGAYFLNVCEPEVFCAQDVFPPCAPSLSFEGFASLSSPLPFTLTLDDAPTLSFAILFYGIGSRTQIPGLYGDVCVGGPYQRTQPVPSGGNPADGPCAGTFEFDFNDYLRSGADPAIVAGSNVIGHFWYRYGAAPGNALFSDAIEMPVCP
ncbi:MAG: right-handed parallel beta-helix repeat-containing protein [Planctomycetota bacterium]